LPLRLGLPGTLDHVVDGNATVVIAGIIRLLPTMLTITGWVDI
jgi:hypothetical protein